MNAYKKPLLRPGGALALQPLLWPCGGFCLRAWRLLGLLGYLLPAELGGLLEDLEGLRPGKQTLNAYKKLLLRPWSALEPLLWPCGGFCPGRGACWACWGTFACGVERTFGGFGAFEAWQTAALNAYKKPLLRPGGALALQPLLWPCGGFCLRAWRVLSLLGYVLPAELGGLLEDLEGLRPGKRQP